MGGVGASRWAAWGSVAGAAFGVWGSRGLGGDPVVWFSLACAALASVPLVRGRVRAGVLLASVALIMGGWAQTRTAPGDGRALDALVGPLPPGETALVSVRAVVLERVRVREGRRDPWDPVFWGGRSGRTVARLEAVRSGDAWVGARGRVRVVLGASALDRGIGAGDRVELTGVFRRAEGARNPGEPDWAAIARQDGLVGTLSVRGAALADVLGRAGWTGRIRAWRAAVRGRAMAALGLDDPAARGEPWRVVLGALVLGERTPSGRGVERSFARVGVAHVLAVSGLHVGLVLGAGLLAVRLTGERPRLEMLAVVGLAVLIVVLIPVRVPIARALALVGALGIARALGRRCDALTVLGWVAMALLVWRPLDALSMGFQLSVAITALLVRLGAREPVLAGADAPRRAWSLVDALKINGACWALATPIVMAHTGIVSVTGALTAIPAAVGAALVMLGGAAQVVIGTIDPGAGSATLGIVRAGASAGADAVLWLDGRWWSSLRGINPGAVWALGAGAWVWFMLADWSAARTGARRLALAALAVLIAWGAAAHLVRSRVGGIRVDMLDVGDGSALLMRSGRDAMLFDAGSLGFRAAPMIERATHTLGVRRAPVAIVSHDNLDHFNALPDLARPLGLETVYVNPSMRDDPSAAWRAASAALRDAGVEIRVLGRGDTLALGGATLRVLHAGAGAGARGVSVNDTSIVARLEREGASILLTGDSGPGALGPLLERGAIGGDPVVLEAPHHGSWGAASEALIERVDPSVVLQSTGPGRVDDPRWSDHARARSWLVTATRGAVWARVAPDGSVERGAMRPAQDPEPGG